RFHCIHSACDLRRTTSEINSRALAFDRHAHTNLYLRLAHTVIIKRVFRRVLSVRDSINSSTHQASGISHKVRCIAGRLAHATPLYNLQESHRARLQRAYLRLEIRATLRLASHIRQHNPHHLFINSSGAHNSHRRNPQTLAIHIRRQSHRTWTCAANVSVMRAVSDVEESSQWSVVSGQLWCSIMLLLIFRLTLNFLCILTDHWH